jgi:hypothetical protein
MNITLNVGGKIFETTYDTIIKIPYFKNMFGDCGELPKEVVFVNRPAHTFKHVLALMMDPVYPFPKKYRYELDFYGIDYDKSKLYFGKQNNTQLENKLDAIIKIMSNTNTCHFMFGNAKCGRKIDDYRKCCKYHYNPGNGYCNYGNCNRMSVWEFCKEHADFEDESSD